MISERILRRWRRDALRVEERFHGGSLSSDEITKLINDYTGIVLRLTGELLDQHLLRKDN